jgi:hypothetical protein
LITLASPTPSGDLSSQLQHRVPYSLRSSTQSTLISHPSWCTPPRPTHRSRVHNNLVSDSKAAATSMSGSDEDPGKMTDTEKLDRILGQLATMNNRLDAHAQWLALLEQEPVQPTGSPLVPSLAATTMSMGPALESHAGAELPSSGAYNGGFGRVRRAPLHSSHRDRYEDGGPW